MRYLLAAFLALAFANGAMAQGTSILCEATADGTLAADGSATIAVQAPAAAQSVYLCGWTIWPNMQADKMDVDVFFGLPGGKCAAAEAPSPAGKGTLVTTVPIDDLPRKRAGVNSSGQPWPTPREPKIRVYSELESEYRTSVPKVAGAPVCVRSRGTNADGKVRVFYHVQ